MDTECLYLSSYRLSSLTDQTWDSSVAFTYHHPPGRSCTICTWHCASTLLLHDSCSDWPTILSPADGHSHRAEEIPWSCSQAWLLAGSRHARNLLLQCCHINWWTRPISPPCHLVSSSLQLSLKAQSVWASVVMTSCSANNFRQPCVHKVRLAFPWKTGH